MKTDSLSNDLGYLVARTPADIPPSAVLFPLGQDNCRSLRMMLTIVRADVSFAESLGAATTLLVLCGCRWREILKTARANGIKQKALVFPLGGSYHEFVATPMDLIWKDDAGIVRMSRS